MLSRTSSLQQFKKYVRSCLSLLYKEDDAELFIRNRGKGVSERCFVFRFAHYLQNSIQDNFYVDCDFNSSPLQPSGKSIKNSDGKPIDRFIDIIIHKRTNFQNNDPNTSNLLCFEIKKWNNYNKKGIEKDKQNLKILTSSEYGYVFGFYISIHKHKEKTRWIIYYNGKFREESLVFD